MITVTVQAACMSELVANVKDIDSFLAEVDAANEKQPGLDPTKPKAKGGRPPKMTVLSEKVGTPITDTFPDQPTPVVEASKPDLFAPAPTPAPAPVATLEEASAALKAIVNTAGMGMPKASAIMEKVTGKKLFREVTPDQYGALVAACKEAMK